MENIVRTLGEVSGRADLVKLGALPDRPGGPAVLVGDNNTLRSTGWERAVPLEPGRAETYDW